MKMIFAFFIVVFSISGHAKVCADCKSKQFSNQIQEENKRLNGNSIIMPEDSVRIVDNDSTLMDDSTILQDSVAWQCLFKSSTDAIFPGGDLAMNNYFIENINVISMDSTIQAKCISVYVQFTIDTNGVAKDVSILRSSHTSLENELIRLVKAMPKWTPSFSQGKKIATKYTLPIQISLN